MNLKSYTTYIALIATATYAIGCFAENKAELKSEATATEQCQILEHSISVTHASFIPGQNRVVTVSSIGSGVHVWDLQTCKVINTFKSQWTSGFGHELDDWVESYDISPDGKRIAVGFSKSTIKTWSLEDGSLINTIGSQYGGNDAKSIRYSSKGDFIVSPPLSATGAKVWDASSGLTKMEFEEAFYSDRIVLSADDAVAWTNGGGVSGRVLAFDVASGDLLYRTQVVTSDSSVTWHDLLFKSSPDSRYLLTSYKTKEDSIFPYANAEYVVKLWDAETGTYLRTLQQMSRKGIIEVSPDSKKVVTVGEDWTEAEIRSLETGKILKKLTASKERITKLKITSDGRSVITVHGDSHQINVWDLQTGKLVKEISDHKKFVTDVNTDESGRRLITSSRDNTVRIYSIP